LPESVISSVNISLPLYVEVVKGFVIV
jgi:hypothetical protein